jgi:hypothetical protein
MGVPISFWIALFMSPSADAATYYASPTGSGSTCSQASPCAPEQFFRMAVAGDTLNLLDGTYKGAAYMLAPGIVKPGLSGTAGNRIIVQAVNDGAVTIDGQFAHHPFYVDGNSNFTFRGFNVKQGAYAAFEFSGRLDNFTVQRVVIWDSRIDQNIDIMSNNTSGGSNILFEDIGVFGAGRKGLVGGTDGNHGYGTPPDLPSPITMTCRRCWFRWEGSITIGPKIGISLTYYTVGFRCENCLVTWSGESMPESYSATDTRGNIAGPADYNQSPYSNYGVQDSVGLIGIDRHGFISSEVLGSLGYVQTSDRYLPRPFYGPPGALSFIANSGVKLRSLALIASPSNPDFNSIAGYSIYDGAGSIADRITTVHGGASDGSFDSWSVTNHAEGRSLSAVPNLFTGTAANLCYRWVNGVITTSPLWPWPMNDRIKAATASAGAYSGPCPGCVGGRKMRTATDVTADVEALIGAIPSQCRSGSPSGDSTPPAIAIISPVNGEVIKR